VVDVLRRALAAQPEPKAGPKVLVGYFNDDIADRVAETVRKAGYTPVKAKTGRDVMLRVNEAADIDLLLLDAALPDPGLASLLAQLRADNNVGQLPVVVTAPTPEREDPLRRFAERYPGVTVVPFGLAIAPKELQDFLRARLGDAPGSPPLSEAELKDYAERAARHLADLALGTPPGYDVRPASGAILDALRAGKLSPEGQLDAIAAASSLPGTRTQTELADVILDPRRKAEVRIAAARALVRHMQSGTPALASPQVRALRDLSTQPKLDPALKGEVNLVLGALGSSDRATGERLREYRPTPAGVVPPPKEKEKEKKQKEK
jgi:CheY-like chemotaxis protein